MLATRDIPASLEDQYAQEKAISVALIEGWLKGAASVTKVPARTNLLATPQHEQVVYVVSGYLHLYLADKAVRLYSDGDLFLVDAALAGFRLESDFACDLGFIAQDEFKRLIVANEQAQSLWWQWLSLRNAISLGLIAAALVAEPSHDFEFQQFAPGDVIIAENDETTAIYELVSGRADVRRERQWVGEIEPGELFGEMSFFVDSRRFASVIARDPCVVRVVCREHFDQLMHVNPTLAMAVARTLAKRIAELNDQLVRAQR